MAKKISKILLYLIVILGAITMLIPFLWMISTSLKTAPETIAVPPIWIPKVLQWGNYVKGGTKHRLDSISLIARSSLLSQRSGSSLPVFLPLLLSLD